MTTRYQHPSPSHILVTCLIVAVLFAGEAPSRAQTTAPSAPNASTASIVNPALYLPVAASVQVAGASSSSGTSTSASASTSSGAATATAAPVALQVSSPSLYSPTSLAAQPQPVTITLAYSVANAGASVSVAPLDGGSINGTPGGQMIAVAANGTLTFSFQAPSGPGRYHVVTRLGNSEMALPFIVPSPTLATPPAPVAAASN